MQHLDNVEPSTRDREEYAGHKNLQAFTVAVIPKLKKSLVASWLQPCADKPTFSSCFWSSFMGIEIYLNEEEYTILRILYCHSLQQHIIVFLAFCNNLQFLHACSHIFPSETKHCYSKSDVRIQLVPFFAICPS